MASPQSAPSDYQYKYPRLSSYYFFYFTLFGALLPYISLYYQELGLNAIEIGQLMAVFVGTKIIAPNLFGWIADRTNSMVRWLRLTGFLTLVGGAGLLFFDGFWGMLITMFVFSFFFHAGLPLFESYTFSSLSGYKECYGQVRLWGSVGFIVAVLGVGWQIDHFSIYVLPWMLLLFAGLTLFATYVNKEQAPQSHQGSELTVMQIIKQPWVISLLVVSILIQFSHGAYYGFYSIHLDGHGYSKTLIAWLWSFGVLAEIAVFFWMPKILSNWTVKSLLMVAFTLTLIRWLMIPAFPESLFLLLIAQSLHAASYGLFHAAAVHLIDEHFQGANRSKGQAIYASTSHGIGGSLGMLAAGYAWYAGGAWLAFGIGALSMIVAIWVTQKWIQSD